MPRFFKENFEAEPYIIGEDAAHITRSLRMRVGEALTVCDQRGNDFSCSIAAVEKDRVCLTVLEKSPSLSEADIKVTLCPCLLKGDKLEDVIKHSVELGVYEIQPILSTNCVSRPDKKSATAKIQRWQKISAEAAGQSGRGIIPRLLPTKTLKELAEGLSDFDLVLFFYEAGGAPLGETLWENDSAKSVAIITGPEGGFTKEEAEMLAQKGAKTVSLGKRILRAETAPLAALTGVMLLTDNLE